MKKTILITLSFILFNCSSDNNIKENITSLNENEFVILIPYSTPLSAIEKSSNELILLYSDTNGSINICQINQSGSIDWNKVLPIQELQGNLFKDVLIFIISSEIYLYYTSDIGLKLMKLDLNGNILDNNIIDSLNYSRIVKSDNGFMAININSDSITYSEYSINGSLLNNSTINQTIIGHTATSNFIKNNNKLYLFIYSNYNSSYFQNFDCYIFDTDNSLINTINFINTENIRYSGEFVLDNNMIMINKEEHSGNSWDENGITFSIHLYDEFGNESINSNFNVNGLDRDSSVQLLADNKICFLGDKNSFQDGKKLNFIVLNSNLDMLLNRTIGGLDAIGTFNISCLETPDFYYLYGITDSKDGDFDLPNNSETTDLFLFKLDK